MRRWKLLSLGLMFLVGGCGGDGTDYKLGERPTIEMFVSQSAVTADSPVTVTPETSGATAIEIEIINTGAGPLALKNIEVEGSTEAAFILTSAIPTPASPIIVREPGGTQGLARYVLTLNYQPQVGDTDPAAKVLLTTNPDANGVETHVVHLVIAPSAPELTLTPQTADFGAVSQGGKKTLKVKVLNTGGSELVVTEVSLEGPGYSVVMEGLKTQELSGDADRVVLDEPWVIGPGLSKSVDVSFAPIHGQQALGTLSVISNDPNQPNGAQVSLIANSGGPCIAVKPQKIQFGGKLVGNLAEIDVDILSCGDEPLRVDGVEFLPSSSGTFEVVDSEITFPQTVGVSEKMTVTVRFVPDELASLDDNGKPIAEVGTLRIVSNTFVPELDIEVTGYGVDTECPQAVLDVVEGEEVCPQTLLHLIGSQSFSPAGGISVYEWTVVQPHGAVSQFLPSAGSPDPTFEANVAGLYTFRLDVTDPLGSKTGSPLCPSAEFKVMVVPCEAIHVELLWDTPNDPNQSDEGPEAGADLDLHFLHPFATGHDVDGDGEADGWFDIPFDTYFYNKQPNWGSMDPNIDDNPGLDRDDTDGAGPENLNLNEPEDGATYRVGVHYWKDHGYGPSEATVRIYIHAVLVFEQKLEMIDCDLWEVATVSWPSGIVKPVTDATGYPKVANYCGLPGWN